MSGEGGRRIAVIGAGGRLGASIMEAAAEFNERAPGYFAVDAVPRTVRLGTTTKKNSLANWLAQTAVLPDVVINCAGWTNVDKAELLSNQHAVWGTNTIGAGEVAALCKRYRIRLLHISTDYVFNGPEPAQAGDHNATHHWWEETGIPRNTYGQSKLAGEWLIRRSMADHRYRIIRTGPLFGGPPKGTTGSTRTTTKPSFPAYIKGMVEAWQDAGEPEEIESRVPVVTDQWVTPTSAPRLAGALLSLTDDLWWEEGWKPICHASGDDPVYWYAVAQEVCKLMGVDPAKALHGVPSDGKGSAKQRAGMWVADRPPNSALASDLTLAGWEQTEGVGVWTGWRKVLWEAWKVNEV